MRFGVRRWSALEGRRFELDNKRRAATVVAFSHSGLLARYTRVDAELIP